MALNDNQSSESSESLEVNKVIYDGTTLIDLTSDTVTTNDVLVGKTFHLASGVISVGSAALATATVNNTTLYLTDGFPIEQQSVSSWELLAEKSNISFSTSSTSAVTVNDATISLTLPCSIGSNMREIAIFVRDEIGPRNGYFYGCDSMIGIKEDYVTWLTNGGTTHVLTTDSSGNIIRATTSSTSFATAAYGIYPSSVNSTEGQIYFSARYNSNYSGTIDGTYSIKVYGLKYPN